MFPQIAVPGAAQFAVLPSGASPQSHPGAFQQAQFQPLPPGYQFRTPNRNFAAYEKEGYYNLFHSPNPWEYSRYEQPVFTPGGNVYSQYAPPVGYNRPGNTVYSMPGVSPGMIRPTHAYNRVVGMPRGNPTHYAWPDMYYPGQSNTYIASWEATGLILKFTRSPSYFRINQYVKELKVPKDQGYYLALNGDDPYRVVSVNDFYWDADADAPGGRQNRQGFGFVPYMTARFCVPYNLPGKGVQQSAWPIMAEHAQMSACIAMTIRTLIFKAIATATANWTGSWGTNHGTCSGTWSTSTSADNFIQTDINTAMIQIERGTGGIVASEDALHITFDPIEARRVAKSPEYKQYIQGSPDALSALTDWRNPARIYGLAPYLYGLKLVVENAVVVTTPKSANVATPGTQARSYIWPTANVMISSKPQGIVAPEQQTLDFSTFAFRFFEQMTQEQKSDPDNRREVGRTVEDYVANLQAPQTGFLFTNAA